MRIVSGLLVVSCVALALAVTPAQADHNAKHKKALAADIDRGRYLVKMGGCNDCHTAGYGQSGGKVPEKDWLLGDKLGWKGAWGTTYASNLRLAMTRMSEQEWLQAAQTVQYRPPMPWFTLHEMKQDDLRAIYQFVKYLGPAGEPAPAYLPPGKDTPPPYVLFP